MPKSPAMSEEDFDFLAFSCFSVNLSHTSVTDQAWVPLPERSKVTIYSISSILLLFSIVGIPMNVLILLVLIRQKFYKEPSSFLLFNLVFVDFLNCIIYIPYLLVPGLQGGAYTLGTSDFDRCLSCYSGSMVIVCLVLVSFHLLAIMSVDRLLYIQKPLHYDRIVTVKRLIVAVLASWIISIFVVIPPSFEFGDIRYAAAFASCTPSFTSKTRLTKSFYYVIFLILEGMIPLGALVIANIFLIGTLRKEAKKRFSISVEHSNSLSEINIRARKQYNEQQLRMVKMFGSIFIANLVTWIPSVLLIIVFIF